MVNWIVDELLGENAEHTGFPSIADAAEQLGHNVYRTKYKPLSTEPDWLIGLHANDGTCTVVYGTVQFCRQIEKHYGKWWTPGLYFNKNVKHWSRFAVQLRDDLLNSEYIILPLAEAKHRFINQESVFIKPESGFKEFTGQVVDYKDDFDKNLSPHVPIDDNVLCVVSPVKDIQAEFRYVIVEKKVVAKSEYRWDNKLDIRIDTLPICDALANKVAAAEWQADTCYVCDIALVQDVASGFEEAKVIELNAFSSSGLYACDTLAIVKAVSDAAEREHRGDTLI